MVYKNKKIICNTLSTLLYIKNYSKVKSLLNVLKENFLNKKGKG